MLTPYHLLPNPNKMKILPCKGNIRMIVFRFLGGVLEQIVALTLEGGARQTSRPIVRPKPSFLLAPQALNPEALYKP